MNTQKVMTGVIGVLGMVVMTTSLAYSQPEYLHFMRHRDSNGNLMIAPAQPQTHVEVRESEVIPSAMPVTPKESPEPVVSDQVVSGSQESTPQVSEVQMVTPQGSDTQKLPSVIQKTVVPSQSKSFEHQHADWGMSVVDVKGNEPVPPAWEVRAPIVEEFEHRVAYRTQIEGIDTSLSYMFYQDQLAQAKYVFEPQHDDASDYIQDFHTVQEWITQSYGAPSSVQEIWLDKLYQYDKSLWGQALLRGHLVLVAEWKNSESQIALVLNGGDDLVGMVADFSSQHIQPPAPLVEEAPSPETVSENTKPAPQAMEAEPKPALSL